MSDNQNSIESGTRFLASMLHEIRTPIQTIVGTAELMEDTNLDNEQSEYVRQIQFSANVLLQLANDILDFTKIQSEEFKLESIPYNIKSLTEKVVDLICMEAYNKGIEVITDIDYTIPNAIMGDPTRVQQVILNLAKNAVKFTSSGYILFRLKQVNDSLLFEVEDTGIGIPDDKKQDIFKKFYQADTSTTRKYGGTGLGLSICKNLIDVMHGHIGVKDNPNGGAIFWFTIPLEKSFMDEFDEYSDLQVPPKTKILIVENTEISALALAKKIRSFGIGNIFTTTKSSEAIELLENSQKENSPFTICFISMTLDKTDGWHLASKINHNANITNLDMYMLVPEGQMGKDAKMKMLNWFKGYLYKPAKRSKIYKLLQENFVPELSAAEASNSMEIIGAEPHGIQELPVQELPVVVAPAATAYTPPDDSELAKDVKILVAEDHPVNRKIIETFLEKFGAIVFSSEDGVQAVETIKEHPDIDMIFMDIQMPNKNGMDATIDIRNLNYNGVIVACTANNDSQAFKEYREVGINDIIVKPFNKHAVKQLLLKWNAVLAIPQSKEFLFVASLSTSSQEEWDLAGFMETIDGDKNLGVELLDSFVTQTEKILQQLEDALKDIPNNEEVIQRLSHTLKGSSATINASLLARFSKEMNDYAKEKDYIGVEAKRIDFALAFVSFKKISENWKNSL